MPEASDFPRRALDLALALHEGHCRKSTDVPYIYHLLSVAALVGEYGGSTDQVAAALLHDAAEDQGGEETLGRIRDDLGESVAEIVAACSDCTASPKPPWRERKRGFIDRIPHLPPDARLVVAADKLHNARSLIQDYREAGESLWERFNGGKDGTLWYYDAVAAELGKTWNHPILAELRDTVDRLHEIVE
jgi:(p)ppGpp synthase/HD superfamily hydrolase